MPPKTRHDLIVLMREVTRDASFSQGRARTRTQRIADLATHPAAYVTVQAFAAYLGFQERTVRKWIDAGALPAYRFPPVIGDWRIKTADAIAFIEQARFQV
jgi:excisionase family DNA binding protein